MLSRRPRGTLDPALPALRRRTVELVRGTAQHTRDFLQALPLLVTARFRRPSLEGEGPGIECLPRRRRWMRLCERLSLPPPNGLRLGRPLLKSVLLLPLATGGLELLFVPQPALRPLELQLVSTRVDALKPIAQRHAPGLQLRLSAEPVVPEALFAWAAVVAGEVPPVEGPGFTLDTIARAPTPLLKALCLLLTPLSRSAGPGEGQPPAPLTVLRASRATALLPFLAAWSRSEVVRDVVAAQATALDGAGLAWLSARFRNAILAELRSLPAELRREVRPLVAPSLGTLAVPRVFSGQLDALLTRHRPREVQTPSGWSLEVDGLTLARAASLDQLRASALPQSPRLVPDDPLWHRLAQACTQPLPRVLAVVEPRFLRHLVAIIPKSGRPRVRRVDASALLRQVLTAHRAGLPVEIAPSAGADPALLGRTAQILGAPLSRADTVALQLGSDAYLVGPHRQHQGPLQQLLRRPRQLVFLPDDPSLTRALRRPRAAPLPTVHVQAVPDGEQHARLYALDAEGYLFGERVARVDLEQTLTEWTEVLRVTEPPTLLTAQVHPTLISLSRRRHEARAPILLTVIGAQVELEAERFGPGAELPWAALGEAVLSQWPPGTWGHVGCAQVIAELRHTPLELLARRGLVLRRLQSQLRRLARALQAA